MTPFCGESSLFYMLPSVADVLLNTQNKALVRERLFLHDFNFSITSKFTHYSFTRRVPQYVSFSFKKKSEDCIYDVIYFDNYVKATYAC